MIEWLQNHPLILAAIGIFVSAGMFSLATWVPQKSDDYDEGDRNEPSRSSRDYRRDDDDHDDPPRSDDPPNVPYIPF